MGAILEFFLALLVDFPHPNTSTVLQPRWANTCLLGCNAMFARPQGSTVQCAGSLRWQGDVCVKNIGGFSLRWIFFFFFFFFFFFCRCRFSRFAAAPASCCAPRPHTRESPLFCTSKCAFCLFAHAAFPSENLGCEKTTDTSVQPEKILFRPAHGEDLAKIFFPSDRQIGFKPAELSSHTWKEAFCNAPAQSEREHQPSTAATCCSAGGWPPTKTARLVPTPTVSNLSIRYLHQLFASFIDRSFVRALDGSRKRQTQH